MGAYKYYNPSTQQWEIVKSKSIIKPDGSLEYTPDDIKNLENDFNVHQAENATNAHLAKNIGLEDISGNFTATELEGAMQELFTNVSSGKDLVGGAITDVDDSVVIPTDPTFQQLADAIGQISTGIVFTVGDDFVVSANEFRTTTSNQWEKLKEIEINEDLKQVRVRYTISAQHNQGINAQVFINGNPFGVERSVTSLTSFVEDIPVKKNDLIQMYLKSSTSSYAQLREFEVSVSPRLFTVNIN